MSTVDGWVELLEKAFPVDRIKTRKEAKNRRYVPTKDNSVMEYVWDKVELLRAANRSITEEDMVEEIWMGLSDEIRFTFDNEKDILAEWTVKQLSNVLIPKDHSFRMIMRGETAAVYPRI